MKDLEEMLINAIHNDEQANCFFICSKNNEELFMQLIDIIQKSDSNDARMEAAYFVSQFDKTLIKSAEKELLILMDDELNSISVHIMIALSRIKSPAALEKIINERIRPNMYWEACALDNYFGEDVYGNKNNKSSME